MKHRKKIGLPPGSVVFTGDRKVENIGIHYLHYNPKEVLVKKLDNQTITQPVVLGATVSLAKCTRFLFL